MSLRDWLAGQAIAGILDDGLVAGWDREAHIKDAARVAYVFADAMLAERAKAADALSESEHHGLCMCIECIPTAKDEPIGDRA